MKEYLPERMGRKGKESLEDGSTFAELQRGSSKILEEHFVKTLSLVGNLYQSSTTLGLDSISSHPKLFNYTTPC